MEIFAGAVLAGIGAVLIVFGAGEIVVLFLLLPPRRKFQARISASLLTLAGCAALALALAIRQNMG